MDNIKEVILVDLTKCNEEEKDNLAWLALAQYLDGKKCAVCGYVYDSREAVRQHEPLEGYDGDVVGKECWEKYKHDGVKA